MGHRNQRVDTAVQDDRGLAAQITALHRPAGTPTGATSLHAPLRKYGFNN